MDMNEFHIEVEGRKALGFDTGLDPAAFAQAKLAQLLSEPGFLVSPQGAVVPWRAEGVVERGGRMTIWGPAFAGERLDRLIERGGALDALRLWIAAREALANTGRSEGFVRPAPYPAAAFLGDEGSILFAPERLALRALDARGEKERLDGAERWVHPDLSADAAESFTAGALAYRILCSTAPFSAGDADSVRADMRDGCALPARLAEPGLDAEIATLIDAAIAPAAVPRSPSGRSRPAPRPRNVPARPSISELASALGKVGSGGVERFLRTLTEEERAASQIDRAHHIRARDAKIGAKRFARRNATVIVAVLAAVIGVVLVVRSIVVGRAERPTTAGMTPSQVVEAYYGAFGKLDHSLMEACVVDKAGKGDIESAMNLFVISRVRMAYERQSSFISADEWIAQGSKPVAATVYGVVDLGLEEIEADESDGHVTFRARYVLWRPSDGPSGAPGESGTPGAATTTKAAGEAVPMENGAEAPMPPPPIAERREDTLTLVLRHGLWRISEIARKMIN